MSRMSRQRRVNGHVLCFLWVAALLLGLAAPLESRASAASEAGKSWLLAAAAEDGSWRSTSQVGWVKRSGPNAALTHECGVHVFHRWFVRPRARWSAGGGIGGWMRHSGGLVEGAFSARTRDARGGRSCNSALCPSREGCKVFPCHDKPAWMCPVPCTM